mgnify:CR=1 FL=1
MPDKFKNTYRIDSSRLPNWDYCWQGIYFVTICTAQREHYFGEIENHRMVLTEIGKIAQTEWTRTPQIRPDMNIALDAFCVMPNHFHGIIIIGENEYNRRDGASHDDESRGGAFRRGAFRRRRRDAMHGVSTASGIDTVTGIGTANGTVTASGVDTAHGIDTANDIDTTNDTITHGDITETTNGKQNNFSPQRKNLASVIRGFKSSVTTYARKHNIEFAWQARFYEHIIRDDKSFNNIRQYIRNNPLNWRDDRLNTK